jgi:hypothetical protein
MAEYKPINKVKIFTQTLEDGQEVLLASFRYRDQVVPAGFVFDGASTPRLFWSIIPPFKKTKRAACVHDWMCKNAKNNKDRKKADQYFLQALKEMGFNPVRSMLGYIGVRLGAFWGAGVYY